MAFIQLSEVSLSYGERTLLDSITFNIASGERVALAGANGSGKTTLMKIMAGIIQPDSGRVICQKGSRISYLPQSGIVHAGTTLYEEAEKAFDHIVAWNSAMVELERELAERNEEHKDTQTLVEAHHELHERIMASGYYERHGFIERVVLGLGFSRDDFQRPCEEFSGGWQMRIALAKVLLERPDMLLLDEPTNYLDLEARDWLEEFLRDFPGGVLIVSHDRYFLDVTVDEVAELFNGRLTCYRGNYTEYETLRKREIEALVELYRLQQEEISRIEDFIRRFRYKATKAKQVQSRIKELEKIERIEIPESMKRIRFSFPPAPHSGRQVLTVECLSKSYGTHRVIRNLDLTVEQGERLVVAGKNGAGKSTFMRIIAGMDSSYSGSVSLGAGVKVGYFSQDQTEGLDFSKSVIEEVEAIAPMDLYPKLRGLLGAFLFRGDDIYKNIGVLSGGELSRLSLVKLLLEPVNLLVLDEPTNHLDLNSKDVLLDALKDFQGTVIFVSHDRYFIESLATKVLELSEKGHRLFVGDYAYYRSRIEAESASAGKPAEQKQQKKAAETPIRSSREEEKQRKTVIRRLEREEESLLSCIEALETAYRELEASLADPLVYKDGEKVRQIKNDLERNKREQDELSRRWEAVEAELQALRS